ncbi:MAG TPA: hypothetical protein VKV27_00050 [Solirubrobacteraceae bacterium]|nr:hypothetical protein [Solirubrobacteraceae bacterium]
MNGAITPTLIAEPCAAPLDFAVALELPVLLALLELLEVEPPQAPTSVAAAIAAAKARQLLEPPMRNLLLQTKVRLRRPDECPAAAHVTRASAAR